MKRRGKTVGRVLLFVCGIAIAISIGWVAHMFTEGAGAPMSESSQKAFDGVATAPSSDQYSSNAGRSSAGVAETADSSAGGSTGAADNATGSSAGSSAQLLVKYASLSIEVKDLDDAIAGVRKIVSETGGEIADLTVISGNSWGVYPEDTRMGSASSASSSLSPRSASITLRIPADKLPAAVKAGASLGTVLSETSSQSDVTQQHIDMKARLDNLIAEEARLRDFLNRAANVTEMLQVEQELSRVRGEIESLTAQLDYLDNQVELSTLTIYLSEPGSAIQPDGGTWGFSAAVRTGIQAAAAVLRGTIIVLFAISPFLVLALVVYVVRRLWIRRHRTTPPTTEV
ncbi:MAG: DUF4349 domain-containing protein [Coriobacteriia bacterium]